MTNNIFDHFDDSYVAEAFSEVLEQKSIPF